MSAERAYKWSFAELIDRISIVNQKIIYAENEEMKAAFLQEREDIIHDIDLFIAEGAKITGRVISDVSNLQIVNCTIWNGESAGRGDGDGANFVLTHGLNSNRAEIKKHLSELVNGRIDFKLNYGKGIWDLRL